MYKTIILNKRLKRILREMKSDDLSHLKMLSIEVLKKISDITSSPLKYESFKGLCTLYISSLPLTQKTKFLYSFLDKMFSDRHFQWQDRWYHKKFHKRVLTYKMLMKWYKPRIEFLNHIIFYGPP